MKAYFALPFSSHRSRHSAGRFARHALSSVVVMALLASMLSVVSFAAAVFGPGIATAKADAATGSGGTFVALEGRLVSTKAGQGLPQAKLTPSTWTAVQAGGVTPTGQSTAAQSIPSTATALAISVEALTPVAGGYLQLSKDGDNTHSFSALNYDVGTTGSIANSAIVPLSSPGGKFDIWASTSIDVYIDVQGYYTAGATGNGGYVPISPTRMADTRSGTGIDGTVHKLSTGTAYVATVPAAVAPVGASAVFVNITVLSTATTDAGYITTYADGDSVPTTGLYYTPNNITALGATVPLNPASGKFDLRVGGSTTAVDVVIDVEGYFAPTAPGGAFTPGAARVFDSGADAITPNSVTKIQIAGVKGIPVAGSGISAVAVAFQLDDSSGQKGYARLWAADQIEPATSNLNYSGTAGTRLIRSNMAIVPLSGDGAISLRNATSVTTGNVRYSMDVIGWYTGGSVIAFQQTRTQSAVTVQAVGTPNATAVTYQYRSGTTGAWTVLPADTASTSVLTKAGTATPYTGGQPIADNGTAGSFDPYVWDVAKTVATSDTLLLQLRGCYTVPGSSVTPCDLPQNLQYSPAFGGSSATVGIGHGTLALQTGDFQVSATDASLATAGGSLTIGRTLTTLIPKTLGAATNDASSVFGPGWAASFPGPDSGEGGATLNDQTDLHGYVEIQQPDGALTAFTAVNNSGGYPISYGAVGQATTSGSRLTKSDSNHFSLVEPNGAITTWTYNAAAIVKWNTSSVDAVGTGTAGLTTYIRNTDGLVTRILAATPPGVSCVTAADPTTTVGCRGLDFEYSNSDDGSSQQRLTDIIQFAPVSSGQSNSAVVAHYDYLNGRLLDEYDPRVTPALKTIYSAMDANGRLTGMTQPGQQSWTFTYDAAGRLSSASQPTFVGGATTATTATTTVVYGVPFTGKTGMPDLSSTAAAAWGQTDLPYTATAVFDPTMVPTTTDPTVIKANSLRFADVTYIDPDGNPVNTAAYGIVDGVGGWQYGASAFDANGNNTWSLTAANRAQAVTPTAATDTWVASLTSSAARAKWLRSDSVYDPTNPAEETDTYGPIHKIRLASGLLAEVRDHTANTYDGGDTSDQPTLGAGDPAYQLMTRTVTSPLIVAADGATGDGAGADLRETDFGYNRVDRSPNSNEGNGWTLRSPTSTTVVGFGIPSLTTVTRYNQAGQLVEKRLPAAAGTSASAASTLTTYYTGTGVGTCGGKLAVAGLLCQTSPGAAPALVGSGNPGSPGPGTATATITYDSNYNPVVLTEEYPAYGNGGSVVTRTTTTHYDLAERKDWQITQVRRADHFVVGGNTDLPKTTYSYDTNTGQLAATAWRDSGDTTNTATITNNFDAAGRPVSYTDASGNISSAKYDIAGRLITAADAHGSYTYTYDGPNEHRGLVTGLSAGTIITGNSTVTTTFGATYDADNRITTETYPNGLSANTGYDNDGNATALSYTLGATNWLSFTSTIGADSRVAAQASSRGGAAQSSQVFGYDAIGRLSQVRDTIAATGVCSTRAYYFDLNSNRTNLTSAVAGSGGACPAATAAPTTAQNFYDTADHLLNDGYDYDQLGRTLAVPGVDARGIGPNNGTTGNVQLSYWSNDLVRSESQTGGSAKTLSYTLDPNATRVRSVTDSSAAAITTNYYDADSDNPDWTSTAATSAPSVVTSWARLIEGPDGNLAATITNNGAVKLNLVNMHGDIVATADNDVNATGTSNYSETTEYGAPRDPAGAQSPYGWIGGKRRSNLDLAGLITMGVRLYSSNIGRFLQVDSNPDGNANPYVYPADPINGLDISGRSYYPRKTLKVCFNLGCINYTQTPWGGVAWDITTYDRNTAGFFLDLNVYVNRRRVQHISTYRGIPHGYVPPTSFHRGTNAMYITTYYILPHWYGPTIGFSIPHTFYVNR